MKIEFQFSSVQIDPHDLKEYYPNIISSIGLSPVVQKTYKRKKSRTGKTVGSLIDEIIADIEK